VSGPALLSEAPYNFDSVAAMIALPTLPFDAKLSATASRSVSRDDASIYKGSHQ
jgi:hypothetical protein